MENVDRVSYNFVFVDPYKNTTQINQTVEPVLDGFQEAIDGFVKMLQLVGYPIEDINDAADMYNRTRRN
jgi:hypothetical protein